MLLTYIIPAYNCRDFIAACLDSLLAQELPQHEYEVIIVDDGSADDTAVIAGDYCSRYPNFKLLRQANAGVGAARNAGLAHAQGRYVHFMDADDRLLPGGMRKLFDEVVIPLAFPDVVSFWSRTVDSHYRASEWDVLRPCSVRYHGSLKARGMSHGVGYSVWTQLVSRALLMTSGLRFSEHKIGEDLYFMLRLYAVGEASLAVTDLNIYRYCVHENSAMNRTGKEHVTSVFYSIMDLSERIDGLKRTAGYPEAMLEPYRAVCRRWAFTRLCSANIGCGELRRYLDDARAKGFFGGRASSPVDMFINVISRSAFMTYLFACFYRGVFLRWIKPRLKRN